MTSTSTSILVPILVVTTAIIGARWVLLRDTMIDRLLNRALTWSVGGVLAYGGAVWLGFSDFAPLMFITSGLLAMANVYALARLLDSGDTENAPRRLRTYHVVAVAASGVALVAVSPIGGALSIDRIVDWPAVLWVGSDVMIAASVVLIARACVRELRGFVGTVQERLTYTSLLLLACTSGVLTVVAVVDIVAGRPPAEPSAGGGIGAFVCLLLYAVLLAVPLVTVVLERLGLDSAGRDCRRLRPMWLDLTTAVPGVVLGQQLPQADSIARRYRMMVEISDALLHLGKQGPDSARAATEKLATLRSVLPATDMGSGFTPGEGQGAVELRMLLELAREWPALRADVVRSSMP
ncbi:DUF6545 domain-containing protein [Nocardia bhagyanarayanae]|uniref:DUF6545 domain-containing protein n=1 Tax=Nocardia bhagyanarayanae TaxID=1215925 RepID=A0A543F4Q2_9NOCA|nr:DUF6545 domain-containing protein [Nocardia bhagyanarayanae]TQM28795.1 hypothetical protein FB390_0370 [Nocardia bhagyanarayanae]